MVAFKMSVFSAPVRAVVVGAMLGSVLPHALAQESAIALTAQPEHPAVAMYERLQALRHRHGRAIYGPTPVDAEALRQALTDIDKGLQDTKSPQYRDLAFGWLPLAGRRLDFLKDRVRVLYRLGQRDAALASWHELLEVVWLPVESITLGDDEMAAWLKEASTPELRARSQTAQRMSAGDAPTKSPARPLTRAQRIEGLSTIWHLARQYFVWFDHVPGLDWDRAYRDALPRVIAARDDVAYWRELMRFTAMLRDGHSNTYPPEALAPQFYSRPGLRTALVEGRVVVRQVTDPALVGRINVGDEVVSIDGVSTSTYVDRHVRPLQSSSTPQDLDVRSNDYGLLAGPEGRPVRLILAGADGHRYRVNAPRSGFKPLDPPKAELFVLRADGVAVLRADHFESDEALRALETQKEALRAAKGLVIDLRGNGGGSTVWGTRILEHLTSKPLPQTLQRVRHVDVQVEGSEFLFWRPLPAGEMRQAPVARPYDGPVVMLVDARTFSAAEDTAAIFKMMKRGSILGMPTGGSTGQPVSLPLPGGGTVRICAKRDSYADGSDYVGKGVQPDVVVPATIAGLRQGKDELMDMAVASVLRSAGGWVGRAGP